MGHESQVIKIRKLPHSAEGSCNACTRFISHRGSIPHDVTDIRLRTISVRLCNDCLADLKKLLSHEIFKVGDVVEIMDLRDNTVVEPRATITELKEEDGKMIASFNPEIGFRCSTKCLRLI